MNRVIGEASKHFGLFGPGTEAQIMTLKKRIDRLTTKTGGGTNGPSVVFLREASGEAHVALVRGGGGVSREPQKPKPTSWRVSAMVRGLRCYLTTDAMH